MDSIVGRYPSSCLFRSIFVALIRHSFRVRKIFPRWIEKKDLESNIKVVFSGFSLPQDVLEAIRPIYENLSNENLLERCVGDCTQNNNESFNNLIWKIAPKVMYNGTKIVQIAACVATCIYNEGVSSLL